MIKPTAGPANQDRQGPPPHPSPSRDASRAVPPRIGALLLATCLSTLLSGCNLELLNPKGSIGEQEKSLILISLFVMLMATFYFRTGTRPRLGGTWAPGAARGNNGNACAPRRSTWALR